MKKALLIITILAATFAAWWVATGKNPIQRLFSSNEKKNDTGSTETVLPTPEQAIPNGHSQPGAFMPQTDVKQDLLGFPLMQGSTGAYVRNLQAALNDRFGSTLVVDGIFGPKTYKAVSAHGFNPDAVSYSDYALIVGNI